MGRSAKDIKLRCMSCNNFDYPNLATYTDGLQYHYCQRCGKLIRIIRIKRRKNEQ